MLKHIGLPYGKSLGPVVIRPWLYVALRAVDLALAVVTRVDKAERLLGAAQGGSLSKGMVA